MEVTRTIAAARHPRRGLAALTEPERLREWFANDVELDLRRGWRGVSRWRTASRGARSLDEVDEGERLVLALGGRRPGRARRSATRPPGRACSSAKPRPEWGVALELEACAAWAIA